MFDLLILDKALRTAAPIDGWSCGDPVDKSTWRIDFSYNPDGTIIATAEQQAAAVAVMQNFSIDDANTNAVVLKQIAVAEAAITDRRLREAFLNVESPTGWLAMQNAAIATLRGQLK